MGKLNDPVIFTCLPWRATAKRKMTMTITETTSRGTMELQKKLKKICQNECVMSFSKNNIFQNSLERRVEAREDLLVAQLDQQDVHGGHRHLEFKYILFRSPQFPTNQIKRFTNSSALSAMGSLRKAATERKAVRQERTAYCGTGHQRWQEPPMLGQVRPGGGAEAAPAAPSVAVVAAWNFFPKEIS